MNNFLHPKFDTWNNQKKKFWLDYAPFTGRVIPGDDDCICEACNKGANEEEKPIKHFVTSLKTNTEFIVGCDCCRQFISFFNQDQWEMIKAEADVFREILDIKNGKRKTLSISALNYLWKNEYINDWLYGKYNADIQPTIKRYSSLFEKNKEIRIEVHFKAILQMYKWTESEIKKLNGLTFSDVQFVLGVFERSSNYRNRLTPAQTKAIVPKFRKHFEISYLTK